MEMEKMCPFPSAQYAPKNWKCVLCCCAKCPSIVI